MASAWACGRQSHEITPHGEWVLAKPVARKCGLGLLLPSTQIHLYLASGGSTGDRINNQNMYLEPFRVGDEGVVVATRRIRHASRIG